MNDIKQMIARAIALIIGEWGDHADEPAKCEADEVLAGLRAVLSKLHAAGEPVATLHDDGHYTWNGRKPEGFDRAGWRMDVYAAPQASAEPVPRGIIDAARQAGFAFHRHADGSYTMQPIKTATAQAEDSAKGAGDVVLPPCPKALVYRNMMPCFMWPEMQDYARAAVLADRHQPKTYRDSADFHNNASTVELAAWQRGWNDCRESDRQQRGGDVFPSHPLGVFSSGKWTWDVTGQAFSHTELDEAAFVAYRAALSAQPGTTGSEQ